VIAAGTPPTEADLDLESTAVRRAMDWLAASVPARGTPIEQLTERNQLALAHLAGAQVAMRREGDQLRFRVLDEFAISPRGDGGYIVAIKRRGT
jgi:hypothetical protein